MLKVFQGRRFTLKKSGRAVFYARAAIPLPQLNDTAAGITAGDGKRKRGRTLPGHSGGFLPGTKTLPSPRPDSI